MHFCVYLCVSIPLEKALMLGNMEWMEEGKRRRGKTRSKFTVIILAMFALLEDLKDQLGPDHHGKALCMCLLRLSKELMEHNMWVGYCRDILNYCIILDIYSIWYCYFAKVWDFIIFKRQITGPKINEP